MPLVFPCWKLCSPLLETVLSGFSEGAITSSHEGNPLLAIDASAEHYAFQVAVQITAGQAGVHGPVPAENDGVHRQRRARSETRP